MRVVFQEKVSELGLIYKIYITITNLFSVTSIQQILNISIILRRFLLRVTESMKIEQSAIRGQLSARSFENYRFGLVAIYLFPANNSIFLKN